MFCSNYCIFNILMSNTPTQKILNRFYVNEECIKKNLYK